jgi:hypothetical protein
VIEDHYVSAVRVDRRRELAHLSRSDERGGLDFFASLNDAVDYRRARARRQLGQLFERFFGVEMRRRPTAFELQPNQDGAFARRVQRLGDLGLRGVLRRRARVRSGLRLRRR